MRRSVAGLVVSDVSNDRIVFNCKSQGGQEEPLTLRYITEDLNSVYTVFLIAKS